MKKNEEREIEELRNGLEPLDRLIVPPAELSPESIADLVDGKKQKQGRRAKIIALRTIGSIAAVLVLALGINTAIKYFNSPALTEIPKEVATAEQPLSGNTQKVIVDYFTALKSKIDTDNTGYGLETNGDASSQEMAVADGKGGGDFGTTNTQVDGIDEEDIVKNDGTYLYVLTRSTLKIVDAGNLSLASSTSLDFGYDSADGIYIYKNYCVIMGSQTDSGGLVSRIIVLDTTNKAEPKKVKEFKQSGYFFTSRLIGGRLIFVSQYGVNMYSLKTSGGYADYNSVVPQTSIDGKTGAALDSKHITILPQKENMSNYYLVLSSIDLNTLDSSEIKTSAVLGAGNNAYCTNDALYIAATDYNVPVSTYGAVAEIAIVSSSDATTNIYRFSLNSGIISLDKTGSVKGSLNNQFSMDEKDGYFRVATTSATKDGKPFTLITVLDSSLKAVGSISNIAPGETVQAVRYIGNYGYVVTFEQTDPLFVIDFSKPTEPKIVGEIKLPGFSSYLHPFGGYLVGIGTSGDENGATNGIKVSLFDISNPMNPKEIDKIVIPNAYSNSGFNHKTVMDCESRGIIGFTYSQDAYSNSGEYIDSPGKFCTIKVESGKLQLLASFENYTREEYAELAAAYNAAHQDIGNGYTLAYFSSGIERGTYIGSTLYACSEGRICAYPLTGGKATAKLDF